MHVKSLTFEVFKLDKFNEVKLEHPLKIECMFLTWEVSNELIHHTKHGVTILDGHGAYSGEKVSVFAFDPSGSGVTLEGFKYPLKNANLFSHYPVGVSNEIIASQGKITVKKGTLLIIISRD